MTTIEQIISELGEPPLCQCGCGIRYKILTYKYSSYKKNGYPKFHKGHQNKGKIHSEKQTKEHSKFMSKIMSGTEHWNYKPENHKTLEQIIQELGKIPYCECGCGLKVNIYVKYYTKYKTQGYPRFIPEHTCIGKFNPFFNKHHKKESIEKISKSTKIFNNTSERRLQNSLSAKERFKDKTKHSMWNGGITPIFAEIRHCEQYTNWRIQVFERDNYTCQECHKIGSWLEPHHKERFIDICKKIIY